MDETRIILSGLWVALMLTYLLGDVLRVFAGDFTAGELDGQPVNRWMWVLAALVMLIILAGGAGLWLALKETVSPLATKDSVLACPAWKAVIVCSAGTVEIPC